MAGNNMVCFSPIKQLIHNFPHSYQMRTSTSIGSVASRPGSTNPHASFVAAKRALPRPLGLHRAPSTSFVPSCTAPAFATTPRFDWAEGSHWRSWKPPAWPSTWPSRWALRSTIAASIVPWNQSRFSLDYEKPKFNCLWFTEKRKAPQGVPLTADHLPEEVEQAQEGRQQCKYLYSNKKLNTKAFK